jgi:hypothetical protein
MLESSILPADRAGVGLITLLTAAAANDNILIIDAQLQDNLKLIIVCFPKSI